MRVFSFELFAKQYCFTQGEKSIKGYVELSKLTLSLTKLTLKVETQLLKLTLKVGRLTFKVRGSESKVVIQNNKLTWKVGIQFSKVDQVNFKRWISTSQVNLESWNLNSKVNFECWLNFESWTFNIQSWSWREGRNGRPWTGEVMYIIAASVIEGFNLRIQGRRALRARQP